MEEVITIPCIENKGINSALSQHFGRSPYYAFVTLENSKIKETKIIKINFENHAVGELPKLMKQNKANTIITYGMGPKAVEYLNSFGIKIILGVKGTLKQVIEKYLKKELKPNEKWEQEEAFSHHKSKK